MKKTSEIKKVNISLGARSYQVHIGSGVMDHLPRLLKLESKKVVVISDRDLPEHRMRLMKSLERAGLSAIEISLPAGESLKNMETLFPVYGEMLNAGIDRSSTLIALGGGTIGDAAGFIASTYLRGISWIGIPTTLLGQVDSAIGGKTAVNHPQGKNLIGTFHQPSLVVCDTDLLRTLSIRERISGLGEVVKYGLTFDPKFFEFVSSHWGESVELQPNVINHIVQTSVKWKAKAVARDEFDRKGTREVLNFGHTFGHALESVTKYETFQHGEAVIWGMRFASALSQVRRKLPARSWQKVDSFLQGIKLPSLPQVNQDQYFAAMLKDKKVKDGKIRFVLLKGIGATVLDRNVTTEDLHAAYDLLCGGQGD